MLDFDTLDTAFEQSTNVADFPDKFNEDLKGIRYLLIRSLRKTDLQSLCVTHEAKPGGNRESELRKALFNTAISIADLTEYIELAKQDLIKERQEETHGLSDLMASLPITTAGVRNDRVDDIIKTFVRNKNLKKVEALEAELDNILLPRIRNYILWSYYNQTANDLIELAVISHDRVLPTLRKIHHIDFFLKLGDELVPMDLKFTHISDEYFNKVSAGLDYGKNDDLFEPAINQSRNEYQKIKEYYKTLKRTRMKALPNLGTFKTKLKIVECLEELNDPKTDRFIDGIKNQRQKYIPENDIELQQLEWWNYKFQGERLFNNNNRFFVFLAHRKLLRDGRDLKGRVKKIQSLIKKQLDSVSRSTLHTINYVYEKDDNLRGSYHARCFSVLYTED